MFSRELNFYDDLAGLPVSIFVQSVAIADTQGNKAFSRSVFIGLSWGDGISATETYVPRKQVKKLIKALQMSLDEE